MNTTNSLLDLPLELISHDIFPYLDLTSLLNVCFSLCHRLKQLPKFLDSLFIGHDDMATITAYSRSFYEQFLPQFVNLKRLEYFFGVSNFEQSIPKICLSIGWISGSLSLLRSLRLAEFSPLRNNNLEALPYLEMDLQSQYFDTLLPVLEELHLDEFFNQSESAIGIENCIQWLLRLPKSLQILRIKFESRFDQPHLRGKKAILQRHPLECLPTRLKRLTAPTISPFPNLSHMTQLEYLCMEQPQRIQDGYQQTELRKEFAETDLINLLPPTLSCFHVIDRTFGSGIVPTLPASITELTLRIPDLTPSNSKMELHFPCGIKWLTIIGGGASSHLFKLSHCKDLQYFKHVYANYSDNDFITSLPIGQTGLIDPLHQGSDHDEIFTFDSLPSSSIKHIHIESSLPSLISNQTKVIIPCCVDFWTMLDWNLHFPFLQSLIITIPLFIENLSLMPQSIKIMNIKITPYKLKPEFEKARVLTRETKDGPPPMLLGACSADVQYSLFESFHKCGQFPEWTWPSKLEKLSLQLSSSWVSDSVSRTSFPHPNWEGVLTDFEIMNPSSTFMRSLPPTLRSLSIRNLSFPGFPAFIIKQYLYQSNNNSISWNPTSFDRKVFTLNMNTFANFANFDEHHLHSYTSLLQSHAFPQHLIAKLDGYCDFDIDLALSPELNASQINSVVEKIESLSIEPHLHPVCKSEIDYFTLTSFITPHHLPDVHHSVSLLFGESFRTKLSKFSGLKRLNLPDLRYRRTQVSSLLKLERLGIFIEDLPESLEEAHLFELGIRGRKMRQNETASTSASAHVVFSKLTNLHINQLIELSHTVTKSISFVESFPNLVTLKIADFPLEMLSSFKNLKSLAILSADRWNLFNGWPTDIFSDFNPIPTDLPRQNQSPLPPSITHFKLGRGSFDIVLIDAPPSLHHVEMKSVRLSVLESFIKSRSPPSEGNPFIFSFRFVEIPQYILDMPAASHDKTHWADFKKRLHLENNVKMPAGDFPLQDHFEARSSWASFGQDLITSQFLACQLKFIHSKTFTTAAPKQKIQLFGNPFDYMPSCVKRIHLDDIRIEYLLSLEKINQLEEISIMNFAIYNSRDITIIKNPKAKSQALFKPSKRVRFQAHNSNQYDSEEHFRWANSITSNGLGMGQLELVLTIWFPHQDMLYWK